MNNPEQNNPSSTPRHDKVDALLEQLPAAYEAWEKGTGSPELDRIQRRVVALMDEESRKS